MTNWIELNSESTSGTWELGTFILHTQFSLETKYVIIVIDVIQIVLINIIYDNNLHSCLLPTNLETYYSISSPSQVTYLRLNWDFPSRSWSWSSWTPSWSWSAPCWSYLTQVTCFSLSCDSGDPSQRQMLAIGLEEGRVEVVFIIVISIIVIIIHIGLEELVFIVVCIILISISIIIIHIQLEEGLVEVIFILRCSYSPFLASLFTSGREGLIQETYHHYHPHCRHCHHHHHHHYHCHHHVHCHPSRLQVMHLKLEYRTEDDESCERELERFLHYVSIIWINRWSKWSKDRNDRNLKIINFKARWKHNYFGGSDNITMWYLIWIKIFKTSAKNSCL